MITVTPAAITHATRLLRLAAAFLAARRASPGSRGFGAGLEEDAEAVLAADLAARSAPSVRSAVRVAARFADEEREEEGDRLERREPEFEDCCIDRFQGTGRLPQTGRSLGDWDEGVQHSILNFFTSSNAVRNSFRAILAQIRHILRLRETQPCPRPSPNLKCRRRPCLCHRYSGDSS